MKFESVDPRDNRWEQNTPTYRVYFWEPGGTSDEYRVTDADVPEILAWADRTAHETGRTYSVLLEVPDEQQGLGLVRLCGWDVNDGGSDVPGFSRPLYALTRPSRAAGGQRPSPPGE